MNLYFFKMLLTVFSGLVFAIGLGLAGMLNPENIRGFLDVLGGWKPELAFVMVGAICIYLVANQIALKMQKPLLEGHWQHLPQVGFDLPKRAVFGALLFGVGWGMGGFCPGPAIVSLVSLDPYVLLFTLSMCVGFYAFSLYEA
jgi:uncharacterized membrane protein YedE/YeeE